MASQPNFFIVGAAKSGTTSLYEFLRQHPEIFMPAEKEPSYFGEFRDRGVPERTLDEYLALFGEAKAVGEASTVYLYSPSAAAQIHRFDANARIIALLRDPVDRAYSHYWHHRRSGEETMSFEQALDAELQRIEQGVVGFGLHYVHMGLYAEQLQRYLDRFGPDRVRVYLFEDIKSDADAVCRDIFGFLGVDRNAVVHTGRVANRGGAPRSQFLVNVLAGKTILRPIVRHLLVPSIRHRLIAWLAAINVRRNVSPVRAETRARLRQVFRDDVLHLQTLIGRDLTGWLEAPNSPPTPINLHGNRPPSLGRTSGETNSASRKGTVPFSLGENRDSSQVVFRPPQSCREDA